MKPLFIIVILCVGIASALALARGVAVGGSAVMTSNLQQPTADISDPYPRGRVRTQAAGVVVMAEPVYVDVRLPRQLETVEVCLVGEEADAVAVSLGIRRQGATSGWLYERVPYQINSRPADSCYVSFPLQLAAVENGRIRFIIAAADVPPKGIALTGIFVRFTGAPLDWSQVWAAVTRRLVRLVDVVR